MEFWGYLLAVCFGALCLFLSHIAYKLGLQKKYTRKLVHILIGFEWVILQLFLGPTWHSFLVCAAFTVFLFVSYFKKLLPMISSDADNSFGTVYYGISMSVLSFVCIFLPEMMLPFGIAVVCTSFGDGFAGVIGQAFSKCKVNIRLLSNKTVFGALANFAFSFFGSWLLSYVLSLDITLLDCAAIAGLSAVLELVTPYGLDNITVPLGTGTLAYLLAFVPIIDRYLAPIIITPLIIALAIKKRVLTEWGVALALVIDVFVSVAFWNDGFLILLLFLVLSVASDKIKNLKEPRSEHNPRDEVQVLANGGAALVCAIAYLFFPRTLFRVAFVGAMAEALADTVSSGFGVFANTTFDLFKMRKCEKGISGGVSIPGTIAGVVAAFLVPTVAFLLGAIQPIHILICGSFAVLGCFIDTLIGSLAQEKYYCKRCNKITDSRVHCKAKTKRHSGFSFVDNNITNFVSNVITTAIIILIGF